MKYKASGGEDFKPLRPGSHIGVCDIVADLGIQRGNDLYPDKRKVHIRFAIPVERVEFERDGKKINGPAVIGQTFTASMHQKANLRIFLEGWRGRKFTDQEAEDFETSTVLGKPAMLNVVQNAKNGKVYANIASAALLPKGIAAPPLEIDPVYYGPDNPGTLELLPQWLRDKIATQVIVQNPTLPQAGDDGPGYSDSDVPFEADDSDIPF